MNINESTFSWNEHQKMLSNLLYLVIIWRVWATYVQELLLHDVKNVCC